MRQVSAFLLLFLGLGLSLSFASDAYELNEQHIDDLFAASVQIAPQQALEDLQFNVLNGLDQQFSTEGVAEASANDNQVIAILLCFFFGEIGVHRVYMGGRGILILYYLCTAGGCGIITLGDFIILIIDGVDRFMNNDRFIAW